MNNIPLILGIVAVILALVDEFRAKGTSLTGWAVVFVALAVIYSAGGLKL